MTPPLALTCVGDEIELVEADLADAGAAARKRIDIADLDGALGRRRHGGAAEHGQPEGREDKSFHAFLLVVMPDHPFA